MRISVREWYTAQELAGLPDLPTTDRRVRSRAENENWLYQEKESVRGKEYHISSLPLQARMALAKKAAGEELQKAMSTDAGKRGLEVGRQMAAEAAVKDARLLELASQGLMELAGMTGKKRIQTEAKLKILFSVDLFVQSAGLAFSPGVNRYVALYNTGQIAIEDAVKALYPAVSRGGIYGWIHRLRNTGATKLHEGHQKPPRNTIDGHTELKEFILSVIVSHPTTKCTNVLEAVKMEFAGRDVRIPSKRALQRWIKDWKDNNASLYLSVTNPDEWKNTRMPAFGLIREGIERLNQLWEFDSTPADVMFQDGRHSILGVIDVHSDRLMLLVWPTSDSAGVARVIRRALLEWGIPEGVKTDNGSDYKSHYIQTIFRTLRIEQQFCQPFSGWEKPHIERAFRTFNHDIAELLPGFIGHNVAERKALEARKAFSDRLFKKGEVIEANMTSDEFQRFANDWLANVYHTRKQKDLDDRSPNEVIRDWAGAIRTIPNERALDVLLAPVPGQNGMRVVSKKGIKVDGGLYINPELSLHVGEPVRCQYHDDMGKLVVYSAEGDFICIAEDPEVTGVSRREVVVEAKRVMKKFKDERKALKKLGSQVKTRNLALEILEHKKRENQAAQANITEFPKPQIPYTSEGLEAAGKAAAVLDFPESESRRKERCKHVSEQSMQKMEVSFESVSMGVTPEKTNEERFERAISLLLLEEKANDDDELKWLGIYTYTSEFRGKYMTLGLEEGITAYQKLGSDKLLTNTQKYIERVKQHAES